MQETFDKFQTSLDRLTDDLSADDRESVAADICLASRSAYSDFFTATILSRKIDTMKKETLDRLFQNALDTMPDGNYKSSVSDRYGEFQDFCEDQSEQPAHSSSLSIGNRIFRSKASDSSVIIAP